MAVINIRKTPEEELSAFLARIEGGPIQRAALFLGWEDDKLNLYIGDMNLEELAFVKASLDSYIAEKWREE